MTLLITLAFALQAAPPDERAAIADAAKATLAKKSWSVQVTPSADLKDAVPKDQAAPASAAIAGALQEDGTWKLASAACVIFGRGENGVTRSGERWQAAEDVAKVELQTFLEEVGWNRWTAHNVTAGKDALTRYFGLAHLATQAAPPARLLSQLEKDLPEFKKAGNDTVDGKTCTIYEGELSLKAAGRIAEGPYAKMIDAKILAVTEETGRGRVWIASDGLIRGITYKVAAKYTVRELAANRKKTVPVSFEVAIRFSKFDQTTITVPKEVDEALRGPSK